MYSAYNMHACTYRQTDSTGDKYDVLRCTHASGKQAISVISPISSAIMLDAGGHIETSIERGAAGGRRGRL